MRACAGARAQNTDRAIFLVDIHDFMQLIIDIGNHQADSVTQRSANKFRDTATGKICSGIGFRLRIGLFIHYVRYNLLNKIISHDQYP